MHDVTLKVEGMHCPSCEKLLSRALGKIQGVIVNDVNHAKGTVDLTIADESLMPAITQALASLNFKLVSA